MNFSALRSTLPGILLCLLIMIYASLPSAAQPTPSQAAAVFDDPMYHHAGWGMLVVDLESGTTILEFNPDQMYRSASTTKLFTMAAALDALGDDYRFKTPIYRHGEVDASGRLNGDLILVAGGDLTLGGRMTEDGHIAYTSMDHTDAGMDGPMAAILTTPDPLAGLDNLARQVAAAGIKRVAGEVIIDDRWFDTSQAHGGFIRSPIMVNENVIDFIITPQSPGSAATVDWRPRSSSWRVDALVETVAKDVPPEIVITSPDRGLIVVRGKVPAGMEPLIRVLEIKQPDWFARALLIDALQRAGVVVEATPLETNPVDMLPDPAICRQLPQVALYTSPPFSETLRLILKVSHNQGADLALLLIAAMHDKRTLADGLALEHDFLERIGIDPESVSLSDGEGGEPADLICPRAAVQLLRAMSKHPDFNAYYQALPILGVDGTLAGTVGPQSPARGKVRAKTGTSTEVDLMNQRLILVSKALAGYIDAASGRRLAFAIYVNNVPIQDLDGIIRVGGDIGRVCEIIYSSY